VDGLWARKSEGVELIVSAIIVSKTSDLCGPDPPTLQTDRQTDGSKDDMQSQYHALHHSASRGNQTKLAVILSLAIH